ncbi:MAG: ABC transporter ATP-binding protein [Planctomycetaceae bacterium]|nr:ABC transporter ATP-binding protein [Planctomycetaceae bacterium]
MTQSPAISVESLQKTYRDGFFRGRRIEALKGVSLQIERGTIFGLLGPNGAGKTTLIKILLGIVRKSGGSASLLGRPVGDRIGRRSVGYLPEHHRIPRHHTANTALEYYGSLSGMPIRDIRRRTPELLQNVGLTGWGKTPVKKFSKGMQQRLGLAQALMHDPELLMLDEPTDGVDPVGRADMRAVLQGLKSEGKTIFINSHLLQEIELICDRVAILVQGELRREGLVKDLTQGGRSDVEVTLIGSESIIRTALGDRPIAQWTAMEAGQYRVALGLDHQPQVDECVDDLRQAGVSIVGLGRRRDTLEEAFLEIVADDPASAPPSSSSS